MTRRRSILFVILALGVLATGTLLWMGGDDPRARSGRSGAARSGDAVDGSGAATAADSGPGAARALRARLDEAIASRGAFRAFGRLVLTRPEAVGAGFELRLEGALDGAPVAVTATTDATGKFSFEPLPRTEGWALVLAHERLKPLRVPLDGTPGPGDVDLGEVRADRWYFVRGRVGAEGGSPLPGAEVAVVDTPGGDDFSFRLLAEAAGTPDPVLAATVSGPDGTFRLRLAEPGEVTLRVRADGWATHYRGGLIVGGWADTVVDVSLTRGAVVAGIVLDGAGRPVGEATVTLTAMAGGRGWSMPKEVAETDGTGRFAFRVEPGARRYVVRAMPRDGIDLSEMVDLPLESELVLRMPGTGAITGRVVDAATGQPVAGADVLLSLSEGTGGRMRMGMPDYSEVLRTDDYGRFRIDGVGASSLSTLAVGAPGYDRLVLNAMFPGDRALWNRLQQIEIRENGETALGELALERGRALTGTVTDAATGAPVANARVALQDFVMGGRATTTDGAGTYRIEGVGDRVAMAVEADGYAPYRDPPFPGQPLEAGDGPARRDIDLAPAGRVAGRVRSVAGEPVVHALVRLRAEVRGRGGWGNALNVDGLYGWTDEEGRYAIDGVPPIDLRVEAEAPGFDRARSEVRTLQAGDTLAGLDLAMEAAARIAGRVVDGAGDPVAGARVEVSRRAAEGGGGWRGRGMRDTVAGYTGAQGRFAIDDVPVGDLEIRVEADGFAVQALARDAVAPGSSVTDLRIALAPAYAIRGTVAGADGEPVTWCWLRASPMGDGGAADSGARVGARVEPDGSFELRGLPEGLYRIEVNVAGWMPDAPRYRNTVLENVRAGREDLRVVLQREAPAGD